MMKRPLALAAMLTLTALASAQEKGYWRAASKTALGVTSDIVFSDERLTLNFITFPIAEIRPLTAAELPIVFSDAASNAGAGHLYRISIPGDKKFLHKTTLCGGDETQWLATYISGKDLELAFFSGSKIPTLTPEEINNATNLCGTYGYVR